MKIVEALAHESTALRVKLVVTNSDTISEVAAIVS